MASGIASYATLKHKVIVTTKKEVKALIKP